MTILGQELVTRRRRAAGSRGTDGRWTDGTATDSTILASVQPANGEDMQSLPEGTRQSDTKKLYTEADLQTADQHAGITADSVILGTVEYQVRTVQQQRAILPHYKALCTRVRETG